MNLQEIAKQKQKNEGQPSSSSTALLRQQRERITELEQANTSLQQQLSEARRIGNENLASAQAAAAKRIAELESELQRRGQKEQQQNEEIVRLLKLNESLNNSDLQLKEAERLQSEAKAKNEESQRNLKAAKNVEAAADRKVAAAQAESREAAAAKAEAERLAEERNQEIDRRVAKKADGIDLQYRAWIAGTTGYGVLATVLTGVRSEVFWGDFKTFWATAWDFACWLWAWALGVIQPVSGLADKIQSPLLSTVVYWLIVAVVLAVAAGIALVVLMIAYDEVGDKLFRGITLYDGKTVAQLILTLAAVVWFAEPIREAVPINLLLLFLLIHLAFLLVRWVLQYRSRW